MKKTRKANKKKKFKIIAYPNPILAGKTFKIKKIGPKVSGLIKKMVQAMFEAKGIGLAAPQIGESLKLAVLEYNPKRLGEKNTPEGKRIPLITLINPRITHYSKETNIYNEGCLSLPGLEIPVERAKEIHVLALDEEGHRIKIRAKGLLARILQHEIDHLEGKLIIDRNQKKINSKPKTQNFRLGSLRRSRRETDKTIT